MTVADALAESLNVPTAYVGNLLGAPAIVRTANEIGNQRRVCRVLPIAIGADESTLAGADLRVPGVRECRCRGAAVCDRIGGRRQGSCDSIKNRAQRFVSARVAYLMTGALEGVLRTAPARARRGWDSIFRRPARPAPPRTIATRILSATRRPGLWRMGRLRSPASLRPARRAGGAAGVDEFHGRGGERIRGRFRAPGGNHDGGDRPGVGRAGDDGLSATDPDAISQRHRAHASVPAPQRSLDGVGRRRSRAGKRRRISTTIPVETPPPPDVFSKIGAFVSGLFRR